jgi:hypothetical protein
MGAPASITPSMGRNDSAGGVSLMDPITFNSIRVLAIRAVEQPGYRDFIEKVQRWYSSRYHVALPDVEAVPETKLLRVYFEETYREMRDSQDEQERKWYEEVRRAVFDAFNGSDDANDASDDAWVADLERRAAEEKIKDKAVAEAVAPPNLTDGIPEQGSVSVNDIPPES